MTALIRYSAPGSLAAYDDLTLAADLFDGSEAGLRALRAAAVNCGLPVGADVVRWVGKRLETHLGMTGRTDSELVCALYAATRDGPDFHIIERRV